MMTNIQNIRSQFPGLRRDVAYLDNAATTQICRASMDAMNDYRIGGRSNVGRGLYPMAEVTMKLYSNARSAVANFVGADAPQCVFTKSVTEGLNMIAFGLCDRLQPGDEILISPFEHHANILPWRRIAKERGAIVKIMPMLADFTLDLPNAIAMINDRTKIVAMTMMSNVLGAVLPIAEFTAAVRTLPLFKAPDEMGADRGGREKEGVVPMIVIDAAQAAAHLSIDFKNLGADALVFGSHKCYGPSGIAATILSADLIDSMEPMIVGGGMVDYVTADDAVWKTGVEKFEGGSPNVEGAIGFAEAVKGLRVWGVGCSEEIARLRSRLVADLRSIPGVTVFDPPGAVGIVSFTIDNMHPHDVADMLGQRGICVRAGNHCAAPLVEKLSSNGTLRASLAIYNDEEDVMRLLRGVREVLGIRC